MELVGRAIELLHAQGSATSAEVARHVFGGETFVGLLDSLRDERLVREGATWRLRAPAADIAILEILASGPNPRRHRIVEVAARHGGARFEALIASPKPVPALLRRLGVPEASAEWPALDTAADDLRRFLGGATVAGFGFVPEFLEQLLGARWPAVDLARLVRQAGFQGRADPATVARHFGLRPPLSRRPGAMLDFSEALLARLSAGRSTAELLVLGEPARSDPPAQACIAEEPGVYVMAADDGQPLYVGKSVNLKRRVQSYLRTPIAISRNLQDLMELTARIDVVPVDTELEALLLEQRLIDAWQPPFNTQRQRGVRPRYLRLSSAEPFPRLTLVEEPCADGATYFGPFRHATAAARVRAVLAAVLRLRTCARRLPSHRKPRPACAKAASGACLAPCLVGPLPAPYSAEVALARTLLTATPDGFRAELRRLLRERPPARREAPKLRRLLEGLAHQPELSLWD